MDRRAYLVLCLRNVAALRRANLRSSNRGDMAECFREHCTMIARNIHDNYPEESTHEKRHNA